MKKIFHEITEIESNQRLDRWLRRSFFLLKQSYIEKLCRKGFIKVNNKKTKPSYKVKFKDIVMHPFFTEKVEEKKILQKTFSKLMN